MESKIEFDRGIVEKTINEKIDGNGIIEKFIYLDPFDKYMKIAEAELAVFSNKNDIEIYIHFNHNNFNFTVSRDFEIKDLTIKNLVTEFLINLNKNVANIKK